jgi:GNAT superfamily N-acetyltransferase
MPEADPTPPFYLIVTDHGRVVLAVEGPMTNDRPWHAAARYARDHQRRIACSATGPDRDELASEYRSTHNLAGVPPGSIVRPHPLTEQSPIIRQAEPVDAEWISCFLCDRWHATTMAVHGELIDAAGLPAPMAENHQGLATYRWHVDDAELVSLNAVPAGAGLGTALIEALTTKLRAEGCARLWLTMTNANLPALRFYLRRGFRLMQVRLGMEFPCTTNSTCAVSSIQARIGMPHWSRRGAGSCTKTDQIPGPSSRPGSPPACVQPGAALIAAAG